jgi:16S rRNA (cytosine967-C5)-methyltransferase
MNISLVGLKALKEIIDNKKSTHLATQSLDEEFNMSSTDYLTLRKVITGTFKHYYLLSYQAQQLYPSFQEDDDEIYLLVLAIYQIRYCRKTIAPFQVIEDAKEVSSKAKLRFSSDELEEKLYKLAETPFRMPEEVKSNPYKFNSLFFSIPEWIIQLWSEQYGDEVMMALLRDSMNPHPLYVRKNPIKAKKVAFSKDKSYMRSLDCKDALIYRSAKPFAADEHYLKGEVFLQDISSQIISDSISINGPLRGLQINGHSGALSSSLGLRFLNKEVTFDVNFKEAGEYRKARYQYQRLGIDNINAHLDNREELAYECPYDSFQLVLATPDSSCLGQISSRHSLLASLHKKDIESYIEEEKDVLEQAYHFVSFGGEIVYIIPTLNKDEGENLIKWFISAHEGVYLEKEKQIMPFDYEGDGTYVAYLRAEEN